MGFESYGIWIVCAEKHRITCFENFSHLPLGSSFGHESVPLSVTHPTDVGYDVIVRVDDRSKFRVGAAQYAEVSLKSSAREGKDLPTFRPYTRRLPGAARQPKSGVVRHCRPRNR